LEAQALNIEALMGGPDTLTRLVAAGQTLFAPGELCSHYVFIRHGRVRVELLASRGQQLVLYRINSGESCVMTTACLLGTSPYFAQAITETQVDLLLMPVAGFRRRLAESEAFREFVFSGFSERLASMMQRTAELATHTVDQRLAAVLLAQGESAADGVVQLTHQQLAVEAGTAREVVSRRLAVFESRGLITRERGQIHLKDKSVLAQQLAQ
jgi:CRP/FNR family transcriptional regulator